MFDRVLNTPRNLNFDDIQHINLFFICLLWASICSHVTLPKFCHLDDTSSVSALLFEVMSYLSWWVVLMSCTWSLSDINFSNAYFKLMSLCLFSAFRFMSNNTFCLSFGKTSINATFLIKIISNNTFSNKIEIQKYRKHRPLLIFVTVYFSLNRTVRECD